MTIRASVFLGVIVLTIGCGDPTTVPAVSAPYSTGGQTTASVPPPLPFETFADLPSPLSGDNAEQILIRAKSFAFGGMPLKRQVEAYNVVFDQPDNLSRFESIAIRAQAAGRLYAFCGLTALKTDRARTLAAELVKDPEVLLVRSSDQGLSQTSAQLIDDIQKYGVCDQMRAQRREVFAYFAAVPLDASGQAAVKDYRQAIEIAYATRGVETAFTLLTAVHDALMKPRNGLSFLESLSEAEFDRLQADLPGVVVGREEIILVKPDVRYFATLAREKGDDADRAFFAALGATYPDSVWAVYNERQTDYSGCTRFGSMTLVDTYRRWSDYQRRFPNRYRVRTTAEIDDVTGDLTTSTCACGDIASVERELTAFVREFPSAAARAKAEERLRAVQAGTAGMRARCKSG